MMNDIKWSTLNANPLSAYILYDRSGSMESREVEAVNSTNSYVKDKELDPETIVTVVAFDDVDPNQIVRDHIKAKEFFPIAVTEVKARGMTPLYDAVGWMIDKIISDNPEKAILVIQTDGYENNSRKYTNSSIKEKVNTLKSKGYQIVFLGSEFKEVGSTAGQTGVDWGSTINRSKGNYGSVSSSLASKSMSYAVSGQNMTWTDAEKESLGDDTAKVDKE